jgi:YegS/Rv2252/BmrU family lipid kinase
VNIKLQIEGGLEKNVNFVRCTDKNQEYVVDDSFTKINSLKKIAFIVRGNLREPDKFRANISRYFQKDFEVFLKFTRHSGHAIQLVEEMMEQGLDYLVGVGGDGTFSEVVNGFMLAPETCRQRTTLVAFPRGSGNDFSRSAGKVNSMEHLHQLIQKGQTMPLDIVEARFSEDGQERVRYYDNSFDIGLGGLVCKFMNTSGKTWGSNFTYFYNILRSFLLFKRIPVELVSDDLHFEGRVLLIALNNGRYFGSGLGIAPDAKLNDGKINVVIARKISILQFLLFMPRLKKARPIHISELFYHEISSCLITSPMKNCPIEMDGEVVGQVPIEIKVLKHAARMLNI